MNKFVNFLSNSSTFYDSDVECLNAKPNVVLSLLHTKRTC